MIGYIYITTNEINDKLYIGKRQKPKFEKWYKGSGKHLKLAFEKYGKDKFHTKVIEWCKTKEDLCNAEKKWISYYRKNGQELYNISDGGDGGNLGRTWKQLPAEKVNEILEKNRQAHIGKNNPFYGKHHTEKTKEVLRAKNSMKKNAPDNLIAYKEMQRAKLPKVVQIDKTTNNIIKVWDNWCDASKHVSPNNRCGYAHIGECCRNERKTAYGYRWQFAESGWKI